MIDYVRTFKELETEKWTDAGGKGGTLGRLYQAGYPVPDGFVILPQAFDGEDMRPEAWKEVTHLLKRLRKANGDISFAVRSSALNEDSAQASFAGEFETLLNMKTDRDVLEAISQVRQSRLSERVRSYSQAQGMMGNQEIAVVVQRLVQSELSGILFTADPVKGSRDQMVGNFVHGMGEALVSGEADAHEFTLKRPKGKYSGPEELRRYAKRLYRLGKKLERELGHPQDIEWAIANGRLYLLQSRPITTMLGFDPFAYDWNISHTGDCLWVDNGGTFPDVLTPPSWHIWYSLMGYHVGGVYGIGNLCGRMYMNISYIYKTMQLIGMKPKRIKEIIDFSMGIKPDEVEIPIPVFNLREWLRDTLPVMWTYGRRQLQLKGKREKVIADSHDWARAMMKSIDSALDKRTLVNIWHTYIWPLFKDLYLIQDMSNEGYLYPSIDVRRQLRTLLGEEEAYRIFSTLSGGAEHSASIGISAAIAKVANGKMSLEQYMHEFGHRHPNENELSLPRPYEDPTWLQEQIKQYRQAPYDVKSLMDKRTNEFNNTLKKIQERFPKETKKIKRKFEQIEAAIHHREDIRSALTRMIGVIRAFFLKAGEFSHLGEDVFFLTHEELLDLLLGKDDMVGAIPTRKETYNKYKALPPYPAWIRGRFEPFKWAADPHRRSDYYDANAPFVSSGFESHVVTGIAGSAGRVEGVVRLLHSPQEGAELKRGEVLLAATTNVGWTPLFPRAAAVVTDIGAPLSHAAIVAREFGIPAVVGCGDATMRLKTGDRVMVDGGRGIVEILQTGEGE